MRRESDTAKFVGHACEVCGERVCGERVNVSTGSGYWSVDPKTSQIRAWHMACRLEERVE